MKNYDAIRAEKEAKRAALREKRDKLVEELHTIEATSTGGVERSRRIDAGIKKANVELDDVGNELRDLLHEQFVNDPNIKIERGSDEGPTLTTSFRGDAWGPENLQIKDRAKYALDSVVRDSNLPGVEGAAERVTQAMDGADGPIDVTELSRWTAATSDPAYRSAFSKLVADPTNGHRMFDADELRAFQRAETLKRAMSIGGGGTAGYMIPFELDPSIVNVSDGTHNMVRQAARTVVCTTDVWHGVSSAGVTASWDPELQEVSDDSPTLVQPSITVHKQASWVPISFEALQDATNVAQEVATLLQTARDDLESVAFISGTGSNQPVGLITALTGVTASNINVTTADTFSLVDLYALDSSLPAKYRANASWLAHRKIYNMTRQFDTSGGAALWVQLANDVPVNLLGSPALEAESMSNTPSGTNKLFMVVGDFSNYVICDRIGTTIEYVPMVFGASNRPIGARGWYCWARTGADSINDAGFRTLNGT